jgi:plastocyanin
MRPRLAGLVAIGCAVALACFSERGSGPTSNNAECSVPVSVIDSMHFVVAIRNFEFLPDSINVPGGATVTWVNCETPPQEPHTSTADGGVGWDSPDLNTGQRFSHTFPATPGPNGYHCKLHPSMLGKVIVE